MINDYIGECLNQSIDGLLKYMAIELLQCLKSQIRRPLENIGNHFTMCVNQTIMLNDLTLYSSVYQLFFNKTGQKDNINLPISFKKFNTFLPVCIIVTYLLVLLFLQ